MTDVSELSPPIQSDFKHWLEKEIQRLSIDTLRSDVVTCTACGEVQGDYIIDYQGKSFRMPATETYAFLKFVDSQS
ncbi:MAG: hypothetical protein AAF974_10015 [Cyanobacteria bacterium P01_E01_bin.34]